MFTKRESFNLMGDNPPPQPKPPGQDKPQNPHKPDKPKDK